MAARWLRSLAAAPLMFGGLLAGAAASGFILSSAAPARALVPYVLVPSPANLEGAGLGIAQAALGTTATIDTLEGSEELAVPAGTQHGQEFTLRGRGVPHLNAGGRRRGDLRVIAQIDIPTKLTDDEAKLLRQFAELRGDAVSGPDKGLKSRIKSAFS